MIIRPLLDLQTIGPQELRMLREQDAPRVRHTTQSLALALGVKESTLLPFLRWADGEQELLHIATNSFEGYANPSQLPVKLLAVRPGPMAIYRGWPLPQAVIEWPASREPLEVPSVAADGYRYNAADEWASVWEIREQLLHAKPSLGNRREGAWARLVDGVLAHYKNHPDAVADVQYLLTASPVRLERNAAPATGPEPIRHKLALLCANEADYLALVPDGRRDWLASRMGIWAGPLTLADLEAMTVALPDADSTALQGFEEACQRSSAPHHALTALERIVDHLRWRNIPLDDVLHGYALHYLERTRQSEWLREQSSY
jgi:hypothetical protein